MEKETVKLWQAIGMLAAVMGVLFVGCVCLKLNTQAVLLVCTLLLAVFARCKGHSLEAIEGMAVEGIRTVAIALIINLCIGMLVSMWMAAGTVSFLIRLCMRAVNSRFFLVEAFVFCCAFSSLIGSCWICAGTVGLALFYISQSLQINPCLLMGAIVGGSRFGACISPISESGNISKLLAGVEDIYAHSRSMAKVAVPAALAAGLVYFIIDLYTGAGRADALSLMRLDAALNSQFRSGALTLAPVAVLGVMIYRKKSAIACMLFSIISGALVACMFQGVAFADITNILLNGYGSYIKPENEGLLAGLFSRGGMLSMAPVLFTLMIGMSMCGILKRVCILQSIVTRLTAKRKSPRIAVLLTMLFSIVGYGATGDSQPAKVLVSAAFGNLYEKDGLAKPILSRTIEMAAFGEGLFPWTVGGVYLTMIFGISVTQYWHAIFFYYFAMLFNIINVKNGG